MQNKNNIPKILQPKLRFPQFTEPWERKKLGEIATKIGDGLHGTPEYVEESDYYFINGNNLIDGKVKLNDNTKKISRQTYFSNNKNLDNNTLLISINGTIGNISKYNFENIMLGKSVAYLNFNFNSIFIFHVLHNKNTQNYFESELTGSTIKNLSLKTIRETELTLPTLPEQKKIAEFLSSIDQKLVLLKDKKQQLETYKKGVMQQLFSQKLRFKDDQGNDFPNWEEKKLGEICEKAKSGGTPKSTVKQYYDGDIPFLSISDMTKQGKYLCSTENFISEEGLKNSSSWILPNNCIIYSMYASVGLVSINKIPIATSQAVLNLLIKKDYSVDYIYYYLLDFQKKLSKYITTGTQGNLNAETVKNFTIQLPTLPEQQKIADFLSALDSKIEKTAAQISATQLYKNALLQQMLV